jgi:hypothetical protein
VVNKLFKVSKKYESENSEDLRQFKIHSRAVRRAGGHAEVASYTRGLRLHGMRVFPVSDTSRSQGHEGTTVSVFEFLWSLEFVAS